MAVGKCNPCVFSGWGRYPTTATFIISVSVSFYFLGQKNQSRAGFWARNTLWATSSPFLGSAAASLEITGHVVGPKCFTAAFAISMTERTEALQRHRLQTKQSDFSWFWGSDPFSHSTGCIATQCQDFTWHELKAQPPKLPLCRVDRGGSECLHIHFKSSKLKFWKRPWDAMATWWFPGAQLSRVSARGSFLFLWPSTVTQSFKQMRFWPCWSLLTVTHPKSPSVARLSQHFLRSHAPYFLALAFAFTCLLFLGGGSSTWFPSPSSSISLLFPWTRLRRGLSGFSAGFATRALSSRSRGLSMCEKPTGWLSGV